MIVVTTDEIPGRQVDEVLGIVMANSVRAKHLGKDTSTIRRQLREARADARTIIELAAGLPPTDKARADRLLRKVGSQALDKLGTAIANGLIESALWRHRK